MKKTLKSISMLATALVALAAVSCTKEETPSAEQENGISTITLSIEQPTAEDATKTALGTESSGIYPVNWSAEDAIAVSEQLASAFVKYTLSSGAGSTTGSFTAAGTAPSGAVYAYYPYSQVKSVAKTTYTVELPTQQTYVENSFGNGALPMFAVADAAGSLQSMKPLMSVLKLSLKGDCKVNRIVVSHASEKLSGPATVTFSESDASLAVTGTGTYDFVELLCPNVQLETSNATAFYIVVPASSAESAYTVRIVTDESKVLTKTLTTTTKFTAAKIKNANELTGIAPTEVKYVSGSYCGDGITVAGYTWAPVNCGYDVTNYPYGKLYQWGRHDGCGYNDGSTYTETLIQEKYGTENAQVDGSAVTEDAAMFYWGSSLADLRGDWLATKNDTRWNSATGDNGPDKTTQVTPTKTANDPCPAGWRVPTYYELNAIISTKTWTTTGGPSSDQEGYLFGSSPNQVFLPAAGGRRYSDGNAYGRGEYFYYMYLYYGLYWSSSVVGDIARYLEFSDDHAYMDSAYRAFGYSVRCVQE